MSSFPLAIGLDNPDPYDKPLNWPAFVTLVDQLVRAEVEGNYVLSVSGAATPSVDDQDKVWFRTDGLGRPIGTYHFYNGAWRKAYDHRIGEVVMYSGDPAADFAGSGHRGTVGGEWDGFQLCNGENGSPNFTNKFIVGAKMDDLAEGYQHNAWMTTVGSVTTQEGLGGIEMALTLDSLPEAEVVTFDNVPNAFRDEVKIGRWNADTTSLFAPGQLYGFPMGPFVDIEHGISIPPNDHIFIPAELGVPPITFPTLPNYYALAYAIFVGYE